MTVAPALLLVEDDPELAELLGRVLADAGYAVSHAPDGQRGMHLALSGEFAAMILDRGLPVVDGLDLLTRLRSRGITTPVIVLSARGSLQDRIEGLDAGAEDYLTKPFDVGELLARLRALLRRHQDASDLLSVPGGLLDLTDRSVRDPSGAVVLLSEREAALLATLAARPRRVFSRHELLTRVFDEAGSENVVDTYVHYCRRKLGREVISTVRGLGYRLGGT